MTLARIISPSPGDKTESVPGDPLEGISYAELVIMVLYDLRCQTKQKTKERRDEQQ